MGLRKWKTAKTEGTVPGAVGGKFVSRKLERKNAKKLKKIQNVAFAKHEKVEKVIAQKLHSTSEKTTKKSRKRKSRTERAIAKKRRENAEAGIEMDDDEDEDSESEPESNQKATPLINDDTSRREAEEVRERKKRRNSGSSEDTDDDLTYEQYLKEVADKKKSIVSDADLSKEDDVMIHRYTKLLGLDKKKTKATPKVFTDEGLDFLLDFCDSDKRADLLAGEKELDMRGEDLNSGESDDDADSDGAMDLSEGDSDAGEDMGESDGESMEGEEEEGESEEEELDGESGEEEEMEAAEDMYGRKINKKTGELIKFDPLGARKKLEELDNRTGDDESRMKIDRTMTGIINRLSEATLVKSKQSFAELWQSNSKNDVKSSLTKIIWRLMGAPYRLQDSLLSTYSLFLALVHATVSSEISAHFIEVFLCDYISQIGENRTQDDKAMENRTVLIAHMMNFRIIKASVIVEVLKKLRANFNVDNLQMIYVLCTYSYKAMKRQCWTAFLDEITETDIALQNAVFSALPRARFLGDQLVALKKSAPPAVDMSTTEHHLKMFHGILKKEKSEVEKELGMGLEDLLLAEERGRWWVVGSAFRLPTEGEAALQPAGLGVSTSSSRALTFPADLLDLATRAKMNTVVRRNVFCTIASASDEDEAFERLLRLSLKGQQEREIIYVIIQMMLKEKQFNPYYPTLVARFCQFDRRFSLTTQFAIWDRVREAASMKTKARSHLASFIHHLISREVMPITVLKVVEWGTLTSSVSSVIRRLFTLLEDCQIGKLKRIFEPILQSKKAPLLTEGLRLFLQVNFAESPVYQKVELWFSGM